MNRITKHSTRDLGYRLTGPEYLPPGEDDESGQRDAQLKTTRPYRPLKASEIEHLVQHGNSAPDWSTVLVTDRFNPRLVRYCRFFGLVRIGDMDNLLLEFGGVKAPVGLYYSTIISCDIGNQVAISHVDYLAHYLIGNETMILSVGRMLTTPRARFGNGTLKESEGEDDRTWLELANEVGDRHVLAFEGMLPADAWLWAKYRQEKALMGRLKELTDAQVERRGGQYGAVGDRTIIRDCRSLIDVMIGSDACLEGADRLEDLTIRSDVEEGTHIGAGTDLAHGIVGYGCEVDSGAKARHFVLGAKASLLLGARLVHTFLGDNSTVACCEVLHSLIFPNHEQHHNNSFLIAATIQGQSNVAAGATIGSNHNSRGVDGELLAGRGFWPGLCTSFKHPCRFAAYALVAKADYPYELNIPLPFSLISNDEHEGCLQIIPAYWFLYNMYAVVRNAWKFRVRDRREHQQQHLEFDYLAPDTVEEILVAQELLENWTARAWLAAQGEATGAEITDEQRAMARELLLNSPEEIAPLEVLGEGVENSKRKVRILKVAPAYAMYREMAHYYAVRAILQFVEERAMESLEALPGLLGGEGRERQWVNLGGQLVGGADLRMLKEKIVNGELASWAAVHAEYDRLWEEYPLQKARHALAILLELSGLGADELTTERWRELLGRAVATQDRIAELTRTSRAKDFTNPFRKITFDSAEEMEAVVGTIEENSFINHLRREADSFKQAVFSLMERGHLPLSGQ